MTTDTVPCYPLAAVLTPWQLVIVRPYMRATFTEMWAACNADQYIGVPFDPYQHNARSELRRVARVDGGWFSWEEEGRTVEAALYSLARNAGCPSVPGPRRKL